jgi:hypothetical protein
MITIPSERQVQFIVDGCGAIKEVKGKVVPVLNQALRHEDVWGSGCIDPRFLDLGTSWS